MCPWGYIEVVHTLCIVFGAQMKVRDILRVKGSTLFPVAPDRALQPAVLVMSEHDVGSLVVMD